MTTRDQGMGRKRTLGDPCSSSQATSKHPRIAPSLPPSHAPSQDDTTLVLPPTPPSDPLPPFSESIAGIGCHSNTSASSHRASFSSQVSTASQFSTTSSASSSRCQSTASDPFPRYALGIPHLDVLLPSRDGLDLLHAYHQGIGWIHSPVDRTTLLETLEEAERHGADSIHPHRLACLLAALALGDLFSPCFPSSSSSSSSASSSFTSQHADSPSKRGRIWFGVASACLAGSNTDAELMRNPTPDACSALYLMSTYLLCSNDEELFHRSQGLTGLALILAKSALVPSCVPSANPHLSSHPAAFQHTVQRQPATAESSSCASPHGSPSLSMNAVAASKTEQERLHCNRLLSDLIFHLRCQNLTFALSCPATQRASSQPSPSLNSLPDVPTIQAIWTAFGTPLYASLDAFGNRYSPNIFHNWKLGLADLMHQVSCLTNQALSLEQLSSSAPMSGEAPITAGTESTDGPAQGASKRQCALPDHGQVVKLDERIRRYHASLPDFLLLHRPLPIEMAGKVDEDELAQIICQRHMACSMVHRMLMALHRPWFLSALACRSRSSRRKDAQGKPSSTSSRTDSSTVTSSSTSASASEPDDSDAQDAEVEVPEQPSASAMFSLSAVLRSATWQTETFASAAACAPPQALAWWQFTNNALAAAVVQATALLRLSCPPDRASSSHSRGAPASERSSPSSHFHNQVRNDLDKNICSFQSVAKRCKLAAKALPFLQRVSNAIDVGFCRSRTTGLPNQEDALQTSIASQSTTNLEETPPSTEPVKDTRTRGRTQSGKEDFNCNNTSINNHISHESPSNSNHRNSNNRNSNIVENRIHNTSHINSSSNSSKHRVHPHPFSSLRPSLEGMMASKQVSTGGQDSDATFKRASSTKSELECIFGPLASGLELSSHSESPSSVKPLYRRNLDPIPVAPLATRDGDEQDTQPSSSQPSSASEEGGGGGGGSSLSSGGFPHTPVSRSPRLEADRPLADEVTQKDTGERSNGNGQDEGDAMGGRGKKSNQASDLVLQCIRFWQPDMLSVPAPVEGGRRA